MNDVLTEEQRRLDPIHLLKEIEAFMCFKSLSDGGTANIPKDDVVALRKSIMLCLEANGVELNKWDRRLLQRNQS